MLVTQDVSGSSKNQFLEASNCNIILGASRNNVVENATSNILLGSKNRVESSHNNFILAHQASNEN